MTEMLFGAIMNDNSANEDGVYHWTLALKDDGSGTYGWREDGSLDFNINIEELLNKAEEMGIELPSVFTDLGSLDDKIEMNEDGTFTIKYDQMDDAIANRIAEAFMGNSTGNQDFSSFINGTMALKDVSTAYENAIQSIANRESDKARREDGLSDKYDDASVQQSLNDFFASLVSADATGILVKNQNRRYADPGTVLYSAKDESFPMALNEGETTFRFTSGFGQQILPTTNTDKGKETVRWRTHNGGDFVNINPGTQNQLICSRNDMTYQLSWTKEFGLNYVTSFGEQLSHMDSSTLKNLISLWGTNNISTDATGHIYGILQNQVIGLTGTTGTKSTGTHLDYMMFKGARENGNYIDPFEYWSSISKKFVNDDYWGFPMGTLQFSLEVTTKVFMVEPVIVPSFSNYNTSYKFTTLQAERRVNKTYWSLNYAINGVHGVGTSKVKL